jgi:hypothetical protein
MPRKGTKEIRNAPKTPVYHGKTMGKFGISFEVCSLYRSGSAKISEEAR